MKEKKFTDGKLIQTEALPDMGITLPEYLGKYRPELLKQKSYMTKEAVSFWTELFEKPGEYESKRLGKTAVIWPYADRLMYLATKFDGLTNREKDFILRCRDRDIFWRGDDIEFFRKVVDETILYRRLPAEGKEDYRKKTLSMALSMALSMVK